jgi:hypothetical protein
MPTNPPTLKQFFSTTLIALAMATFAFAQSISTSGPTPPPGFQDSLDRFNADVAAWNKRCRITRTAAEDAWCKKERALIDARKVELIARGAIGK